MIYCVGLTGGIASGKSSAAAYFKSLGVAVISADEIAKQLTSLDQPALEEIRQHFGEDVIEADGSLNRRKLRTLIFSNTKERLWLENLLHPLIKTAILKQAEACDGPYCIIEIPLLKQRSDYPYLQRILVIQTDSPIQIERVMSRDACDATHAKAILNSQPSDAVRLALADDVVHNNGALPTLHHELFKLHQKYLTLSQI